MGFHMSQTSSEQLKATSAKDDMSIEAFVHESDRNIKRLYFIHFLISSLLILMALYLLSCSKPASGTKTDYGPQVTADQKDDSISKAMGPRTILSVKQSEYVLSQFSQHAYTGAPEATGATRKRVHTLLTTAQNPQIPKDQYWLKFYNEDISFKPGGQNITNAYLSESCLNDNPLRYCDRTVYSVGPGLNTLGQTLESRGFTMVPQGLHLDGGLNFSPCSPFSAEEAKDIERSSPGYHITYHALKEQGLSVQPPPLVTEKTNCGGIPNCKINISHIEYDEILWNDVGGNVRYHCTFEFSNEVPYLASLLRNCIDFLYKTSDGRQVPVTLCADVIDFETGKSSEVAAMK